MSERSRRENRRCGATVVEVAFVLGVFLLFLFGVVEYCRFIFLQQLVDNAAREGARFAVVNTTDSNLTTDVQTQVNNRMGGMSKWIQGYNVQVYLSDSSGNNIGAATSATFGQYIAVEIKGTYNPIVPQFLFMGKSIPIDFKCLMNSEAN